MIISDAFTKQSCERVLQNRKTVSSLDNITDLESHCIRGLVLYKPCHRKNEDYPQMSTVMTLRCNASNSPLDTAHNVVDIGLGGSGKTCCVPAGIFVEATLLPCGNRHNSCKEL